MTLENNAEPSEQSAAINLDIPLLLQSSTFSSVPCCIKMVIDYYSEIYPEIHTVELDDIIDSINTSELGTCNDKNLDNINKLFKDSIPSFEFVRDFTYPSWNTILSDLKAGKPVILWVEYRDEVDRYFYHSVVVIGLHNNDVIYNDPFFGKVQESIGSFLDKWDAVDRFTLRIKINERKKRKITEYIEKGDYGNE